jgi:hypothetical protein
MKATFARHIPASLAEAAWGVAVRLGTFGFAEISAELRITMEKATLIVRGWEKEGAVHHLPGSPGNRKMFRADADFVRLPSTGRTAEDNMWTSIRKLRSFTPAEVAAHSTTETVSVTRDQAALYCRALLGADYLTVTRKAAPLMKREPIYRLVTETGPLPPVIARVRALRDPNTGQIIVLGDPA